MDLTSTILSEGVKQGFSTLLLLAACFLLVRWIGGLFRQIRDDAAVAKAESIAREEKNRQECLERERLMAARLNVVEDRQFNEHAKTMERSAAALEMNARTFEKLIDRDSGLHRALVKAGKDD